MIMQWLAGGFLVVGTLFYVVGTVGLLRFPDVYTRLHALTKVDNLGLGLLSIGLILQAPTIALIFKYMLIWSLALGASATSAYLVANAARRHGL